jgi:hypothetical protein
VGDYAAQKVKLRGNLINHAILCKIGNFLRGPLALGRLFQAVTPGLATNRSAFQDAVSREGLGI